VGVPARSQTATLGSPRPSSGGRFSAVGPTRPGPVATWRSSASTSAPARSTATLTPTSREVLPGLAFWRPPAAGRRGRGGARAGARPGRRSDRRGAASNVGWTRDRARRRPRGLPAVRRLGRADRAAG